MVKRLVVGAHYGLRDVTANDRAATALADGGAPIEQAASYEQLGARFGLSVQRVRQIERGALEKLRAAAR